MDDYKQPTAGEIKTRWQKGVDDMLNVRRNYWLNEAFYHGEQWLAYNDTTHELMTLEFRDRVEAQNRAKVNKIGPRTVQFEARMVRTPLGFQTRPEGVDPEDLRRAQIADQILDVEAHRSEWENVRAEAIHAAMLGGVSVVAIEPGYEMSDMPAPPQGMPAPEEPNEEPVEDEGVPVPDVWTGEKVRMPSRPKISLQALSVPEFCLEPGTRSSADARWWIRCTTLTPEQAQERYGLAELPQADANTVTSAMHKSLLSQRKADKNGAACLVWVYYERPTDKTPGCVCHVVGNEVVLTKPWPFPWDDCLNIEVFVQRRMSGTWKGDTILNDARPLQVTYNRLYSSINAHIGKADNARMIVPAGSVMEGDDEFTGDAAEIIRINPDSQMPQWMQAPQVPRWLREHLIAIEAEMDDLFSAHAVSRGEAPGDRNSGAALAILAEKDETPLGLMATNQQRGWQRLAEKVLMLNKHLMSQPGLEQMQVKDVVMGQNNLPDQVVWSAADIPESPIVHVPLETVMPKSQVAVQDAMIRFAQTFPQLFQQFAPSQLANLLQTPNANMFADEIDAQTRLARYENSRIFVGAGDEEIEIAEWHDHPKHILEHNDARASAAYRNATQERKNYMDLHVQAHEQLQQQQMVEQMQQQLAMQMQQQGAPPPGEAETPEEQQQ